ncbi:MAG: BNR-4 repeat-containing protein [Saprospiraceae bacterium]|nr:BNR-4 repeat-containing protein [Saprospiraceae bacterium]
MRRYHFLLSLILTIVWTPSGAQSQQNAGTLTDDGAWCWFSDPRAILTSDKRLVTGWVKKDGSVEAAQMDLTNYSIQTKVLYDQLEVDDHDNPAFAELPSGEILCMYTWHGSKDGILWQKTDRMGNIQSFSKPVVIRPGIETLLPNYPRETYTYANPYYLSGEKTTYSFGRWIGYKPDWIKSTDGGETWGEETVIISRQPFDPGNRPYVKYSSDGKSKIHLVFTDGHPRVEPLNSVYHCYYENDAFWRSDGSRICTVDELPFDPKEATVVYRASSDSGRAWLADIGLGEDGTPYVLYTRHPEETDHRYHYSWYSTQEDTWIDYEICKAGRWFPQTPPGEEEREQHYHGNLTIHPSRPDVIFLSRQINGRFEIEKRITADGGKTWDITPVTTNSEYDQVRPYIPRNTDKNDPTLVLWMENKEYVHYTDFDCRIRYWLDH